MTGLKNKGIKRVRIPFEGELCIYNNRDKVLEFLDKLSLKVLKEVKYVEIDLSNCVEVTAAACLLLFAEITRCQNVSTLPNPFQAISILWPEDKELYRILRNSGFREAVKPGGERKLSNLGKNDDILFCSGNSPAEDMQLMENHLRGKLDLQELPQNIARAISEAFLNIVYHAYEDSNLHEFMNDRWWLYCDVQYSPPDKKEGRVIFLIYDKGLGIPYTVSNGVHQTLLSFRRKDSECIKKAFEDGYSCTGDRTRGLGTKDLKKPLITNKDCLLVFSGKGIVEFDKADCSGRAEDQAHSVGGTLLEWTLWFNNGN